MSHLSRGILSLLGTIFGLLILAFTGYQTWSLLFEVTGDPVVATIGLILFEGGTLYWWSMFKQEAEGILQMSLSALLFVLGLALMVGSNGLHLGAIDPTFLGAETPQRLILVAAIVQLVGKLLFPLFSPEVTQNIWQRALEGMLLVRALMKTEATVEEESQRIANNLGAKMARRVEMSLYTNYQIPLSNMGAPQLSAGSSSNVIEHNPSEQVGRPAGAAGNSNGGAAAAPSPSPSGSTSRQGKAAEDSWWQRFKAFMAADGTPGATTAPPFQVVLVDPALNVTHETISVVTSEMLRGVLDGNKQYERRVYEWDGTAYVLKTTLPAAAAAAPSDPSPASGRRGPRVKIRNRATTGAKSTGKPVSFTSGDSGPVYRVIMVTSRGFNVLPDLHRGNSPESVIAKLGPGVFFAVYEDTGEVLPGLAAPPNYRPADFLAYRDAAAQKNSAVPLQ